MNEKLQDAAAIIGRHLDAIRREVFKAGSREQMKLTFIARDPSDPECDIFLSEDEIEDVIDLLRRTVDRAQVQGGSPTSGHDTRGASGEIVTRDGSPTL